VLALSPQRHERASSGPEAEAPRPTGQGEIRQGVGAASTVTALTGKLVPMSGPE
jgi:hypothetical protein